MVRIRRKNGFDGIQSNLIEPFCVTHRHVSSCVFVSCFYSFLAPQLAMLVKCPRHVRDMSYVVVIQPARTDRGDIQTQMLLGVTCRPCCQAFMGPTTKPDQSHIMGHYYTQTCVLDHSFLYLTVIHGNSQCHRHHNKNCIHASAFTITLRGISRHQRR